ncbi:ferritin-like domain-containing protein [Hoyosella sp. YIM 151337]|uniref:ferritin-like domain-containing protein n=1 Tax=Hoyosella sp. YIM 151337 TaxID=2992742 RepID=UPI00223614F7|nr:ferritin-like domain-containing protein [Hoyosella sp. YIM 151337]MCW4353897.1 ferritin-like domain-containing protein [Hoyosella sp. YIM 151337]
MRVPNQSPAVSRRRVFQLAALTALSTALPGISGCTVARTEESTPDPLIKLRDLAARDAQSALAAIPGHPEDAALLTAIAAQRGAHARALDAEVQRVAGPDATATAEEPAADTSDPRGTLQPAPVSVTVLASELSESAEASASATAVLSGYRAGLLAAISANCATHVALLTETPPPPVRAPAGAAETSDADVAALAAALEREHAAIFSYGVTTAFSLPERRAFAAAGAEEHRFRRDLLITLLTAAGGPAPVAAAAYTLPLTVDSPATAAELALVAEGECSAAWRSVAERAESPALRELAVAALAECTLRIAGWRDVLSITPRVDVFPGQPD